MSDNSDYDDGYHQGSKDCFDEVSDKVIDMVEGEILSLEDQQRQIAHTLDFLRGHKASLVRYKKGQD